MQHILCAVYACMNGACAYIHKKPLGDVLTGLFYATHYAGRDFVSAYALCIICTIRGARARVNQITQHTIYAAQRTHLRRAVLMVGVEADVSFSLASRVEWQNLRFSLQ